MSVETDKVFRYLQAVYSEKPNLGDIFHTFKQCSWDKANGRSLVESGIKCINFDKLTKWIYSGAKPQSADSMTFARKYIYLIEFKAGNQVEHDKKREKLIKGVVGKINDSEDTLYTHVLPNVPELETEAVKLRFYLVVDTREMGISPLVTSLAALSMGPSTINDPRINALLQRVLPDLKEGVDHPDRFDRVDIWYSELFDTYLASHGINDVTNIQVSD